MSDNILVIAPHADDEILGVGGCMRKHVENGDRVHVVIVTDRHNMSHQRTQAEKTKDIIGHDQIHWCGLKDEYTDICMNDIIKPLEHVYQNVLPGVVYTCHRGDVNIDHQAVFKASTVVCRALQSNPVRLFLSYEIPSSTEQGLSHAFVPNYYVTLNQEHVDRKVDAFLLYDDEIREQPNPRNRAGLVDRARYRGSECNSKFAEAFVLLRNII
jgi:N-acetylglucosamine malate deacetylase 1